MYEILSASVFHEVALLLVLAAGVGFLGLLLKQPLIVSFIAVGILAGPSALNLVSATEHINLLSELGIALLLFLVGIKLDLHLVRKLGTVSLMTGLGQVLFTAVFGYLIGIGLGFAHLTSLYIGIALTFSSTIIIVKLLSDKREIDSLHGRIALGFLIVQDIVVVLAMISLSAIGIGARDAGEAGDSMTVVQVLLSGLILVGLVLLFIRYLASPLTQRLAASPELLICFAIALAVLLAAAGETLGFGKELGGLLAGVALASTPFRDAIAARLAPLRDFLLLFFFIALGTHLDLSHLGNDIIPAMAFSAFVLIGNPLIVLIIMGIMGYRRRTGFMAGLTVAQISEFSLIFAAMGVTLGHINQEVMGLVTLVGLITIAASTYMITYSHKIYPIFDPFLAVFERKIPWREQETPSAADDDKYDTIFFGLGRYGTSLAKRLNANGERILGVDFDPSAVKRWQKLGLDARYGDAMDPEFIASLPLSQASQVIALLPDHQHGVTHNDSRLALMHALTEQHFSGRIVVHSQYEDTVTQLKEAGAHIVLEPFKDAADFAMKLLTTDNEQK
ncbi:MAG: cation:proton antiporter family protein [Moraxellaceae bacterium]|nr:cation:proton antiporter family protein [Moraxellaceae bacterium]MDZ4386104.1 cation:proton antiporter family protein [Moraxellaceae bacterium]